MNPGSARDKLDSPSSDTASFSQEAPLALIIGAGPAGLTAAYEFLKHSSHLKPIVYEASNYLGGLARTVNYKGNRMDIGGHRFFSKSEKVLEWWQQMMEIPCVAIGGITPQNALPLVEAGADFLAVSGAVWNGDEAEAVRAFSELLG